jgi:hypothetical protein
MEETSIVKMLMEQVVPQLVTALGLGIGILIVWLKSKTAKAIRGNVQEGLAQKALLAANGLIMDLVGEASQTTVKELKKALGDGKITEEEYRSALKKIKDDILNKVWSQTGGQLLNSGAVTSELAGRAHVGAKIESAVPLTKAAQAAAGGTKPKDPPIG